MAGCSCSYCGAPTDCRGNICELCECRMEAMGSRVTKRVAYIKVSKTNIQPSLI